MEGQRPMEEQFFTYKWPVCDDTKEDCHSCQSERYFERTNHEFEYNIKYVIIFNDDNEFYLNFQCYFSPTQYYISKDLLKYLLFFKAPVLICEPM